MAAISPTSALAADGPQAGAGFATAPDTSADGQSIDLSALLSAVRQHPAFQELLGKLAQASRLSIADPAKAYVTAALHSAADRPLVLLTARPGHARQFWEELSAWSPAGTPVLHFPAPDALPYERLPEDPTNTAERVRVLAHLAEPEARPLIVLCLRSALDRLEAPERFRAASRTLRAGDQIGPAGLVELWLAGGYEPTPLVGALRAAPAGSPRSAPERGAGGVRPRCGDGTGCSVRIVIG